ncbi:MAG: glycosyltransferase [Bacteroidales bacterium]|nr:glycosyltransferase [Bacteroidales bacterium]
MTEEKLPYRILILPSWYPPDGGTFFRDHAEALNSREFEVHVLANRTISFTANSFKEILLSGSGSEGIENGVLVVRRSTLKWPKLEKWNLNRWIRKYILHFEKYRKKHGLPDIMIVQSSLWAGAVAARLKKTYRIPYILVEHRGRFTEHLELTEEYFEKWYLSYLSSAFSNADQLVCVSDSLKNKISEISHVPVNQIQTIPNLVDTDFFVPSERQRELQPFVFLSAGFFERIKGFDILLAAFARFLEDNEGEFFLRIAGRGKDDARLKKYARDLGIMERVHFIGHVSRERMRDEMQRSNVFVLPSRFESFGVVLIEAIATACPVIATRSGGPSGIVNENNGFLVDVEDEYGLAEAMGRIYLSYENFNPEIIRREAIENYNTESVIEKYRLLIRDTLHEYRIVAS